MYSSSVRVALLLFRSCRVAVDSFRWYGWRLVLLSVDASVYFIVLS